MIKPAVYICGASDCFPDPDWPDQSWMEHLQLQLPDYTVISLAVEGASNFMIRLQIDRAIERNADFIIVNFTCSIREDIRYQNTSNSAPLLDRYYKYYRPVEDPTFVCYSPVTLEKTNVLSEQQKQLLKQYHLEFSDLELSIQKHYYFIQGALDSLSNGSIPFRFSTGGFEHESYLGHRSKMLDKLEQFSIYQSPYNLWDYITDFKRARPYFHITDQQVNAEIASYYAKWINKWSHDREQKV
jgi:hypothetical protein